MKREFNMNTTKKLVMLLALMLPVTAIALPPYDYDNYEFEVDGIYYKIEGDAACVTFQRYASGMHLSDYHGDVVIPSTVTYQDVTYPVTTIDYYAFNYCQGLTSITIPESITTIKDCAFYLCTSLTCVNLLTPTVVIEKHAFSMCSALTTITCPLTTPPAMYYEECFDSPHYESATLYVPANAVELYRNAPVWEKFVNIQPIDPEMLPGDVNGDGEINIADINAVIDVILGGATNPSANVNNDGEVNIADVNAIIDIILGGSAPNPSEIETITVNGVSFNMVKVEGGTFMMGATDEQISEVAHYTEYPAHQVTLSSYCIGQTEVTQALWQAVMGNNPSSFSSDLNNPVEQVSWNDCQEFISKLNQMTGKTFRLPTEAEWEYAARGGNKSQGYIYAGSNDIDEVAWYSDNNGEYTNLVATKAANELGLYDMSGNVYEWCQDRFGYYSSEAQINPTGPSSGNYRIFRGGGWNQPARDCRVSHRYYNIPDGFWYNVGLRLVLVDEHQYVDLGLPSGTLWATCNVGATKPEEYGDYFAWGETEPKQVFDWSNYKWCNGTTDTFTKYCDNAYYGSVDNKMELEPEDDAAYMNWGPEWRMPNLNQIGELCNNCSIQWTMRNDVNGWLFTGPNENTLFLPATGYRWNSSLITGGSRGYFWSISLLSVIPDSALAMVLFSDGVNMNNSNYRSIGMTVRAVRVTQN